MAEAPVQEDYVDPPSDETPAVRMAFSENLFTFFGPSMMEDPRSFYDTYTQDTLAHIGTMENGRLEFKLNMSFLNSQSLISIGHMLNEVARTFFESDLQRDIHVEWHVEAGSTHIDNQRDARANIREALAKFPSVIFSSTGAADLDS